MPLAELDGLVAGLKAWAEPVNSVLVDRQGLHYQQPRVEVAVTTDTNLVGLVQLAVKHKAGFVGAVG